MLPKHRAPTHPGEILQKEFIEPMGLNQTILARHLSWSHAKINEIVRGKRGVTVKTALALSDTFGTTPDLWLNLQKVYDLWHAAKTHQPIPSLIIVHS